jgi:hypothetical protein
MSRERGMAVNRKRPKQMRVISALAVMLVGACRDDSSSEDASADEGHPAESADATDGEGGAMCGAGSTLADCPSYCAGVIAAACPGGPSSPEECEQGCEMLNDVVGQCPAWGALVECAQTAPSFTCFMGAPVPEGCEDEFYCVSLCFD